MSTRKILYKTHLWTAIITMLPLGIMIISGILLQLKKDISWIQPATQQGSDTVPQLTFEEILAQCRTLDTLKIKTWEDIERLDIRPGKGIIKILAKNNYEIQLDSQTGKVLHIAYRRSDIIENIHDGSIFSSVIKKWIFIPSAFIALALYLSGIYLTWKRLNKN